MVVVVPCLEMPALRIETEPVERTVGDDKIARGMQRPAGGLAVNDVEHARMTDGGDYLAAVVPGHQFDRFVNALRKTEHVFARFKIVVGIARLVVCVCLGITLCPLVRRDALEYPIMTFAQLRHRFDFKPAPCRHHLCGRIGTAEVAAIDGVKIIMGGVKGHRQRLTAAGLIERYVGLTLNAFCDIPVGLTMANEADSGRHD